MILCLRRCNNVSFRAEHEKLTRNSTCLLELKEGFLVSDERDKKAVLFARAPNSLLAVHLIFRQLYNSYVKAEIFEKVN